jgi:predicted nuclease of predicted toxin-antitoxin system
MKFLIDAQLPASLCHGFRSLGHDAIHVEQLPDGSSTSDSEIIDIADESNMIVVTKDSDFYYSHILNHKPRKLLLVRTGNTNIKELKEIFEKFINSLADNFEKHDIIELHKDFLIL